MIWTIALGILLGYILIQLLPSILLFIGGLFKGFGEILTDIFNFICNFYKWLNNIKWYYRLLVFIILFFLAILFESLECILILIVAYNYFIARFLVRCIKKFNEWNKNVPHKDFHEV